MVATAELVLFGIQSALKLARAARQAYVEDTAGRRLTLPIPDTLDSPLVAAWAHARDVFHADAARYAAEFESADRDSRDQDPVVRARGGGELIDLYLRDLAGRPATRPDLSAHDRQRLAGLYVVRQWQEGTEPFPAPLQRVGGALVEVAIDYFLDVPGALDSGTKHGDTVRTFLQALDDTNFQEAHWESLAVAVFRAAIQTASDHPQVFTSNEDHQKVLGSILGGVASETSRQIEAIRSQPGAGDFESEGALARFSRIVLRSALRSTASELLTNPDVIRIGDDAQRKVVESVGSTLIGLLFDATGDHEAFSFREALQRTVSTEGFEKLVLSAIKAAGENPAVFGVSEDAVETWLGNVLKGIYEGAEADGTLFDGDLFAEVAYLVVDHGLRDLPALLGTPEGTKGILVTVARSLFDQVATRGDDGIEWKFALDREDLKEVFRASLATIAKNPQWLSGHAADHAKIAAGLALVTDVLGNLDEGLLKAVIRSEKLEPLLAAVLASELATKIEGKTAGELAGLVRKVIDGVLADGRAGLLRLLQDGSLADVLTALANDAVLEKALGDDAAEVDEVLTGLVELLAELRGGEVLTLSEMVEKLAA
jgi:hypothetical protein